MRVTQSIIARNLIQSMNLNREKMNTLQTNIATGKEIHKSSDDPTKFSRATRFKDTISQNEQYIKNIIDSHGWINSTSSLIDDLYTNIVTAKEIALQGSDASQSSETRATLANRIDSILNESLAIANTKYLGKNLFSGTKTMSDTSFSFDGASVSYNGNSGNIVRRIGENLNVSINISGTQLVDTNLFDSLVNLRDALNANDVTGIQNSVQEIESSSKQILSLGTAIGSIQNQLQLTQQRLESTNINFSTYLSEIEDADLLETITRYNSEEMAYQAALQTTNNAISLNLMDFLR